MGSRKSEKKPSINNTKKNNKKTANLKNPNSRTKFKTKETISIKNTNYLTDQIKNAAAEQTHSPSQRATASRQLSFFIDEYQSANGVKLSSLELESIKDTSFVELGREVKSLGKHLKGAFGESWKQTLCEGQLEGGRIEAGNPAVLIISTSALRSIELLRGVRLFTKECRAVKLFSKHMKVEEQVALLKNRVNFASGTPNRVKKLIDIEALGLSRLTLIVLDLHTDVKGYSLLTLPQVSDEFWDLYKNYLHQRLVQGDLRICLFGPIPNNNELKGKRRKKLPDE